MRYVFTQEDFCDLCETYLKLDEDLEESVNESIFQQHARHRIRQLLDKAEEIE